MIPKIRKPFEGNYPISLRFGDAPYWYVKVTGYSHNGIDYPMLIGTSILACDDGIIEYADNEPDKDGLGINLRHSWGMSQYWHLKILDAKYRDSVKRGDVIGCSGASGWATGPHLHFGIRIDDVSNEAMRGWSDPSLYFGELQEEVETPAIEPKIHLVLPGDSLWKISEKYYGYGIYWPKIFEANKEKIKDPNKIYPLQRLLIP